MTNALDTEFADFALEICQPPPTGMGTTGTFVFSNRTINPATRGTSGDTKSYPDVPCSPIMPFDVSKVDGKNVMHGDGYLYLPQKDLPFTLSAGMKGWTATVNGRTLDVFGIQPMHSGDDVACWFLHLRN